MAKVPLERRLEKIRELLFPPRPFYRVAVEDILKRGDFAEIQANLKGARELKKQHGDLDGLIAKLDAAAKKAKR